MLARRDMGQLLQLLFVSRRATAGERARGGNNDHPIFHRLRLVLIHFSSGGLHIHLLQVSEMGSESFGLFKGTGIL